ncbi:MAG TPA: thioesterase family protein [Labilithrix sp.]|nr:thioesterase family protein [Labilithrix sp.]
MSFEDVDAAGIVFFARLLGYAHDAMERLFEDLPGGYAHIIMQRGIGFPAVHVTSDFLAPIRYGDTARITATIRKLGATSMHPNFAFTRVSDGTPIATTSHVHVCTSLSTLTKLAFPPDIRAALEKHLAP